MSTRLAKKNARKNQQPRQQENHLSTVFSIYDEHLDHLYRQLARKTDKIDWVEQSYSLLPFVKISNVDTDDAWLLPADNDRNKKISVDEHGVLSLDMDLVDGDSFYLQTGSMDINGLPHNKDAWRINGDHKYQVHLDAIYGKQRPDCAMFFIQYDAEKRIAHKYQQIYNGLNKIEFETAPDARYFSIALRFKGQGTLSIKPLKIIAEEMLPVNAITLESCQSPEEIARIFELKAKALTSAFEKRIHALPDSPMVQKTNLEALKDKLATALYEKQKIEKSLYYRLGKTLAEAKRNKLAGLLTLPQKLIKIRAAKRKGKFEHSPMDSSIRQQLLEQVGIFNEARPNDEITWPAFEPRARLRNQHINVVSISDKFTYECFRYEANFIPLTKKNWKAEIDAANPVLFFVESAWNGNDGEWTYTMASYKKHLGDPLRDAIKYCQSKNIPVVFWNKEDPTNYDVFIDVAADCDYIFTTDGGIVDKYKARVGHDRVYPLAFAAQPAIHNPIRDKRKNLPTYEACFAGSWYNNGHDTRRIQTEIVLDGAMHRELHVYDRMLHATQHRESRIFPAKYQPFIVGSLSYDQMVTAYRQYKLFLNINTVQDSPTMFSRRVFEILACGTPVVSTHSDGMKAMLGDHVYIVDNKNTAKINIDILLNDEDKRRAVGHLASRHTLQEHTYKNRFEYIVNKINGNISLYNEQPLVSIVMCTNRPHNIDLMINNFIQQKYDRKELIVIINTSDVDLKSINEKLSKIKDHKLVQMADSFTLGECLNKAVELSSGDVIAKLDDDDIYGSHYITDAVLALEYSGADVVGKDSHLAYVESMDKTFLIRSDKDCRFSDFIIGASLIIRKEVFEKVTFHNKNKGEDSQFLKDCNANKLKIYSSDIYNYITIRSKSLDNHTWKIEDKEFVKNAKFISNGLPKEIFCI
ncbi:glycosyltransferase family protein [Aeromonas dhakensis]|uniref:glycosyltransferase family protein n=3 Tax=Aeromonas dhakensis TaxID=196024 RepID=UPI003D1DCE8A